MEEYARTVNTQWRRPIQVILIEDNEAEAAAIAAAIAAACAAGRINGHVVCFQNGSEALAALQGPFGRDLLTRPFLILLDLDLADHSGLPFLDALRDAPVLRRSIVFAMSHSSRDEDKAAAYDRRVAGYLVKDTFGQDYAALCDLLDLYERSIQFPLV